MTNSNQSDAVENLYTAAHAEQYTKKDLKTALKLYRHIIEEHAEAHEAAFSRAQVQHIVNSTVPKQELFDTQVALAEKHLGSS